MRLNFAGGALLVLAIVALIVAYGSLFILYPTHQALVVRFGKPVDVVTESGLHTKLPIVDSVISIDKRILDLENSAQEITASDQKRLVVDAFARYRIVDPLKFYQTVSSIDVANSRLSTLLNSGLRRALGEATLQQIVRDERAALMTKVRDQLDQDAAQFGLSVIDVRIRRADLPEQNSEFVYARMQSERQREAAEFRAQGRQRAAEIKARADRDVTVIKAEANSKAEQVMGEGDAERNGIFADAYNKDPEFFTFQRSMLAYEAGLKHNDTRMLLRPNTDFFRYFLDPAGKAGDTLKAEAKGDGGKAQSTKAENTRADDGRSDTAKSDFGKTDSAKR